MLDAEKLVRFVEVVSTSEKTRVQCVVCHQVPDRNARGGFAFKRARKAGKDMRESKYSL